MSIYETISLHAQTTNIYHSFIIFAHSYPIAYLSMVITTISIHDHASTYLTQMIHATSYVCTTFLPTIGSLSHRYSLLEVTPELGMSFLQKGRERQHYLTTTYIVDFICQVELYWVPIHNNMLCNILPHSSGLPC